MFINPPGPGELYIPPGVGARAGLVLVVTAALVTHWVLTRDLDDPDARAERYRDRPGRSAVNGRRTPAWWIVRLQLAVGIGLTLLVARLGMDRAMTVCFGGCHGPAVGPLPSFDVAVLVAALAVAVAGLVWMVRIIRGPGEELTRWRYRDH